MRFATATSTEGKAGTPRLPAAGFLNGAPKGSEMKLHQEHETEVFLNAEGGVSISQQGQVCMSCGEIVQSIICFGDVRRIRAVAKELLRLADEIEAEAEDA